MSDKLLNIFVQSHAGSWAFIVILFIVSAIFYRQKITPMILRLFYLIMVVSGVGMLIGYSFPAKYVVKGIIAIVVIGLMEMILGRMKRGQGRESSTKILFAVWAVLIITVIMMGFGIF
ncbi:MULTISPECIES: DUF1516 family protein [Paenibacillus]|uniref:DUF1516 family protein n=1 Tax=Paenibacillus lutrae TaxID=2078573 RepID=A0A7X3JZN0_9BACL|nr:MULTISPECIES: DUF1516 family protein [Paenibacillus]MVP00202.1 DUF1516 family protein [Paenibacillus lutrae]